MDWVERNYWCTLWLYRRFGVQSPWGFVVKIMPKRLKYWVLIDQGVKHIHTNEIVPNVRFTQVLQRSGDASH